jgi:hypothetical protein
MEYKGYWIVIGVSNRLITIHIGSKRWFLPQEELVQKSDSANGDYYEQMNYNNFSKLLLQVPQ